MGRRSDFARMERDYYRTWDVRAVLPLLPHLRRHTAFDEPCCGDGSLIRLLEQFGHRCELSSDLEPEGPFCRLDAFRISTCGSECFITNPPWSRKILHPLISHLSDIAPTWMLFDYPWAATLQAIPFKDRLRKVVTVGRLRWIPETPWDGKDDCAWYLFDKPSHTAKTLFFLRHESSAAPKKRRGKK